MKQTFHTFGLQSVTLACVSLTVLSNAAQAQDALTPAAKDTAQETTTVYPPYVETHKVIHPTGSKTSPPAVEATSLSRGVTYSDLDLSQPTGVILLERRVRVAAADVCNELDRRYPKGIYTPVPFYQNCVRTAVAHAMPAVKQLEAAATRRAQVAAVSHNPPG